VLAAVFLVALAAFGLSSASGGRHTHSSKQRPAANVWVDVNGGACHRTTRAAAYVARSACSSIDAAWDACRPGDTIRIRAGVYGPQTITGNKRPPGCVVKGAPKTTLGDLVTSGAFLTLEDVTVDVGDAKRAGWKVNADHVSLKRVRIHGSFASVDISGVTNVRWNGGELGTPGVVGGRRVCGEDAEPVQIAEATDVVIDGVDFHPQNADPTPSSCSANGFHLEMVRIDSGTSRFVLRNSTFDNGDHSGTASVFITQPGGLISPHDLVFENDAFGTNEAVGAFDVHSNVSICRNFTFAYNTFLATPGAFQCTADNVRWIGNLGARSATATCFGTFVRNVWQDSSRDTCGSDRWVLGARWGTDRLGLGGSDGFHLQRGSPAIDRGEPAGFCTTGIGGRDRDGQLRPRGTRCDAGADEQDPGAGPVNASLRRISWTHHGLVVALAVGEAANVDARILRGGALLSPRRYVALRRGRHAIALSLAAHVAPGPAQLWVAVDDRAGNELIIRRSIRVPRSR